MWGSSGCIIVRGDGEGDGEGGVGVAPPAALTGLNSDNAMRVRFSSSFGVSDAGRLSSVASSKGLRPALDGDLIINSSH